MKKAHRWNDLLLAALVLLLAGCGAGARASVAPTATVPPTPTATATPTIPPDCNHTVHMTLTWFDETTCTIKAGEALTFVVPVESRNLVHFLCIGQHQKCNPVPGAPAELNVQVGASERFDVGESHPIVFPNAGTFGVTCFIHPGMNLTVIVTAA